jgi:hypothetical protein
MLNRPFLIRMVAALAVVLLVAGPAAAGKRKGKKARKSGTALNMPRGWTWPPSQAMLEDGQRCLETLDALGIKWEPAPATKKIATPIYVPDMELGGVKIVPTFRKPPFIMDCQLAEDLAVSGGPALRALGVKEIRFGGIYEYRNIKGKSALSRHAVGLAIDIYEMVTDDGVVHVVDTDYKQGDTVLLEAEKALRGAGYFRGPLTPGNDPAAHHDHFHLEGRTAVERSMAPAPPSI